MPSKTKIIHQDGKRYEFTPGEGGGLIVRKKPKVPLANLDLPRPEKRAKTIGPVRPQYALKSYGGRQVFE